MRSTATRAFGQALHRHRSAWHEERELAAAVLGTVVGSAAMVAAGIHGTLGEVVASVVFTLLVYWVAERYADLLAASVHSRRVTRGAAAAELRRGWPMLEAASTPVAALLVVAAPTGDVRTGVLTGLSVATVLLGWLGLLAARRAGRRGTATLPWVAGSACLGLLAVGLKLLLH